MTHIPWTDATWNPVTGCTKVSPGCAHCYIERTPPMRMAGRKFVDGKIPITLHPGRLEMPLRWRQPRRVFVCSMGDLWHDDVPDEFIARVFSVMVTANRHTFQVLTKRPGRMRSLLTSEGFWATVREVATPEMPSISASMMASLSLRNVWLMVSAENQKAADERLPILMETPATVRGVSLEPLLGPLELGPWLRRCALCLSGVEEHARGRKHDDHEPVCLNWVIVGGESGGPPERRLVARCGCKGLFDGVERQTCIGCHDTGWGIKSEAREWVRSIRDQCQAAGVPFWFKQWGPRAGQGTLVDGREHKEMPRQEVRA